MGNKSAARKIESSKIRWPLLWVTSSALGIIGCAGVAGGPPPPPPITISVTPNSASLPLGATQQFTATITNT
ncbi:MAG TPA: hypothetical protein VN774_02345, partial [Candidatus Limnocylindrales bacterium]|nr:hypothetical protein [Candidatus Limnocylindrales bacterium]